MQNQPADERHIAEEEEPAQDCRSGKDQVYYEDQGEEETGLPRMETEIWSESNLTQRPGYNTGVEAVSLHLPNVIALSLQYKQQYRAERWER